LSLTKIATSFWKFIRPSFKEWIYNLNEYNHLKKLIKSVKKTNILSDKTVVINTARTIRNSIDAELYYGLILSLNGAKVKVLLDDGVLYHWDTLSLDNWNTFQIYRKTPEINKIDKIPLNPHYFNFSNIFKKDNYFLRVLLRKNTVKRALKTYKNENIEYIYYSRILKRKNIKFENIEVLRKHAESSTKRFFRDIDLDYNNKYIKYYYNLSLKNAVVSQKISEYILNEIKPDVYITQHGYYSMHGPAFEFLKKKGINVRNWITISHTKSVNIKFEDTLEPTLTRSNFWKAYKNTPVTDDMKNKVKEFFNQRFDTATIDMQTFHYMKKENIILIDKKDGYKYHVAMFPNVGWDSNVRDRHVAFNGLLDWLLSTVNYFKNRDDLKLYIKAHPGELYFSKTTPRILDILKKYVDFTKIKNIELIPPEKQIYTYTFLKSGIDLGIIYDGILSLEMPYLKIPTIVCGWKGFASVENGNHNVATKEEYFQILDNIESFIKDFHNRYEKHFNNIVRYVYWYVYENLVRLPSFNYKVSFRFDLMQLKKEDLKLEDNLLRIFN